MEIGRRPETPGHRSNSWNQYIRRDDCEHESRLETAELPTPEHPEGLEPSDPGIQNPQFARGTGTAPDPQRRQAPLGGRIETGAAAARPSAVLRRWSSGNPRQKTAPPPGATIPAGLCREWKPMRAAIVLTILAMAMTAGCLGGRAPEEPAAVAATPTSAPTSTPASTATPDAEATAEARATAAKGSQFRPY